VSKNSMCGELRNEQEQTKSYPGYRQDLDIEMLQGRLIKDTTISCRIWGSHGGEYEDCCLLGNAGKLLPDYTALQPRRQQSSFISFLCIGELLCSLWGTDWILKFLDKLWLQRVKTLYVGTGVLH
jgi:hypothetical protein